MKSKNWTKKKLYATIRFKKVFFFAYNKQISSWKVVLNVFFALVDQIHSLVRFAHSFVNLINSCEKHVQTTFHEEIYIFFTSLASAKQLYNRLQLLNKKNRGRIQKSNYFSRKKLPIYDPSNCLVLFYDDNCFSLTSV